MRSVLATLQVNAKALVGVLVACVVCPVPGTAFEQNRLSSSYHIDVWQTEHGLPQNAIRTILQTREGYIWLATEEGLVRFDGMRFRVFDKQNTEQIRSNSIRALLEDKDGGLWVGTTGGLTLYKDHRFNAYTTSDGLSSNNVETMIQDQDGQLWIGTSDGLNRRAGGRFTSYRVQDGLPHNRISAIRPDPDGGLWIGTPGGLVRYKDGKFTAYTSRDGLANDNISSLFKDTRGNLWISTLGGLAVFKDGRFISYGSKEGLSNERIWAIHEDRSGALWIGTDGGLHRFDGNRFVAFTTKDGLSDNSVWAMLEDSEGSLWLGTPGGLNRLRDGLFTSYSVQDGLSDNVVLTLCQDREGSLWIGTEAGGLNRLKAAPFTTYTTGEGLSNNLIWTIYEGSDGSLWFGTQGGGLNRYKDRAFTSFTTKNGLASNIVRALSEDRDRNLWIGTPEGLTCLRDGKFRTYTVEDGLSSNAVWAIEADREGRLWIGTLGGLTEFRAGEFRIYTAADGLSDDRVSSLRSARDGSLWIGTRGGVLNRLKDGAFESYFIEGVPTDESIRAIYEDDGGTLWLGTQRSGLYRLKNGKLSSCAVRDGLFDNSIFQILDDGRENLWMSSPRGVFRVSKRDLDDFADKRVRFVTSVSYGTADGMASRECNGGQPAGCRTRDGRIWFPTVKGAATIAPDKLVINRQPPTVVVEQVVAGNDSIEPGERVEMAPGQDRYEFHYTGLSLIAPEKVRFRYRLEGFDDDWIEAGVQRIAHYTNISPGTYRFRVLACNNDGIWSESGTTLEFYLRPYFYQTYWFYGLCAAAIGLAGLGAYRLRLRRVRARFSAVLAERNRMAREIHDTLAQGFVGIGLQLKAVERELETDAESARQHLELARQMVKHSIAEARRTVWDLRSHALETNDLVSVLSDNVRQMTSGTGVKAEFRVSGTPRPLPGDIENNILRLCQEALTNAMKHAQPSEILVELEFQPGIVRLGVKDDGCGFDPEAHPSAGDGHFGLTGMRERVAQLGGTLSIKSRSGEGTGIEVMIPRGKESGTNG